MSKKKKKRNKVYSGENAAAIKPTVIHVQAKSRSKFGQWWFDHKKIALRIGKILLVIVIVTIIIVEIINISSGKSF